MVKMHRPGNDCRNGSLYSQIFIKGKQGISHYTTWGRPGWVRGQERRKPEPQPLLFSTGKAGPGKTA